MFGLPWGPVGPVVPSTDKTAALNNGAALVRVKIWPKPYHMSPHPGIGVRDPHTWKYGIFLVFRVSRICLVVLGAKTCPIGFLNLPRSKVH